MTEITHTLLIKTPWDQEEIDNFVFTAKSMSHIGSLGNTWVMKCHSEEEANKRKEDLEALGGVEYIIVAKGDTTWQEYFGVEHFDSITADQFYGYGKYGSGKSHLHRPFSG